MIDDATRKVHERIQYGLFLRDCDFRDSSNAPGGHGVTLTRDEYDGYRKYWIEPCPFHGTWWNDVYVTDELLGWFHE